MTVELADIVVSLNGRDEGKRFIVVKTEAEYSFLADGKGRRVDRPKKKKNKHLRPEDKAGDYMEQKIKNGDKLTNNDIRRALAQYATDRSERGGI